MSNGADYLMSEEGIYLLVVVLPEQPLVIVFRAQLVLSRAGVSLSLSLDLMLLYRSLHHTGKSSASVWSGGGN